MTTKCLWSICVCTFVLLTWPAYAQDGVPKIADPGKRALDHSRRGVPAAAAAAAPANDTRRKIYAVLLTEARDATLGAEFRGGAEAVQNLLVQSFEPNNTDGVLVTPQSQMVVGVRQTLTDQAIVNAINDLPALDENSTLFCWYNAHGGQRADSAKLAAQGNRLADSEKHFFGHFFQCASPQEQILRFNLWSALKQKNAGLTVLVSDSCFPNASVQAVAPKIFESAPAGTYGATLRHLLTKYKGDANLNACSKGQFSIYLLDGGAGGLFSRSFLGVAEGTRSISWNDFFTSVQAGTQGAYQDLIDQGVQLPDPRQTTQRPMFFGTLPTN